MEEAGAQDPLTLKKRKRFSVVHLFFEAEADRIGVVLTRWISQDQKTCYYPKDRDLDNVYNVLEVAAYYPEMASNPYMLDHVNVKKVYKITYADLTTAMHYADGISDRVAGQAALERGEFLAAQNVSQAELSASQNPLPPEMPKLRYSVVYFLDTPTDPHQRIAAVLTKWISQDQNMCCYPIDLDPGNVYSILKNDNEPRNGLELRPVKQVFYKTYEALSPALVHVLQIRERVAELAHANVKSG